MSGERYEIRTVEDFLKVPPERLGACLREFRVACDMARAAKVLLEEATKALGHDDKIGWKAMDTFTWIDDKAKTATLVVRSEREGEKTP